MHIEQRGQGTDLVLVHGWSMHSGVWQPLLENMTSAYRLHLVDLPGHGRSDWHENDFELDRMLDEWQQKLPDNAVWLGWSLGGLLTIAMAQRHPEKVSKLILLAATPCFTQRADWSSAMPMSVFDTFAASLELNQQQTLQRFLMLQAKGAEQSRDTLQQLSQQISQQYPPKTDALKAGLALLQQLDMREAMRSLNCPVQMILGGCDNLIPASLAQAVLPLYDEIKVSVIDDAGHAPFISHPQYCQKLIDVFIHG